MGTILVAVRVEERHALEQSLGGEHDLRWASSLEAAVDELDRDVDAIVCSVHFDDGRLFDLIEMARLQAGKVPVYGIVMQNRRFTRHFLESLRSAVHLAGGQGVLDLAGLRDECGDREAFSMLRVAMEGIIQRHRCGVGGALRIPARARRRTESERIST